MGRYVALLRGINVGGQNLIKMVALKGCFEEQGFFEVLTYIQSGNVVFSAKASGTAALCRRIEAALAKTFGYRASVVLRSHEEMRAVVRRAPKGFGKEPAKYRYDAVFLKAPLTAKVAVKRLLVRKGVDEVHAGDGVLYFSRLDAKASQSQLNRVASLPIYQSMTIRNWNTTTALVRLMDELRE
jgi:uncharacterized protein (DUF1697 family)